MTDAPVWLLDVDGVINVFGLRLPGPEMRTFKSANGYSITYRVPLLERMAALHESGRIEIQWLTTWEELADLHLAEELGLPRGLTIAGTHAGDRGEFLWWKHNAAREAYATERRVIWTDDDIVYEPEARAWLQDADPERIIWMAPDQREGITDEFMDRVEKWL